MFVIHISLLLPPHQASPYNFTSFLFITFEKERIQTNSSLALHSIESHKFAAFFLENCLWKKIIWLRFYASLSPSPFDFPQSHLLFHNLEQFQFQFHRIKYPEKKNPTENENISFENQREK